MNLVVGIELHPKLLTSELVRKYFIDHDDLDGKIKTIYMTDQA